MSKKGKFGPHDSPISGRSLHRNIGSLLALAGWYKPLTRIPFGGCLQSLWSSTKPQSRAQHTFLVNSVSLSWYFYTHCRVSKLQQKTCLLREQRTRAPIILTSSWRSWKSPQDARLLLQAMCYTRIHDLRKGRILTHDQRPGLTTGTFCVTEFKRDRKLLT